jgi:hypothetical protein
MENQIDTNLEDISDEDLYEEYSSDDEEKKLDDFQQPIVDYSLQPDFGDFYSLKRKSTIVVMKYYNDSHHERIAISQTVVNHTSCSSRKGICCCLTNYCKPSTIN